MKTDVEYEAPLKEELQKLTDDKEWIDKEDKLSFRGFMDSGKTTLVKETLFDDGFTEGGRSVVICCEDGDAESVVVWGKVLAMAFVAVLPLIVLFFAAQKYFVEGIATSGMKG